MKILVIGAHGTIGEAVVAELASRHTVITAGKTRGDIQVDITQPEEVQDLYEAAGALDAVAMAIGGVKFAPLAEMSSADYLYGLERKLMGQINVVLAGLDCINDQGSFTLISGILNRVPVHGGSAAAMVNGALEGFVKSAACDMPRGLRINCVSPDVLVETLTVSESHQVLFRGHKGVMARDVALAYSKSIEGIITGQVLTVP